jgi:hypothetical protein
VTAIPEAPVDLERLLAKQALHELITAFSRAVDRLDEPALVDIFHPDAIVDSGVIRGAPAYFAREFVQWVRQHARLVFHAVTNEWFQVSGLDAIGESYVVAASRLYGDGSGERDVMTFGRYLDRFQARDGRWKFLERRFVLDHSVIHPSDSSSAGDPANTSTASHGAFAPFDPICQFWGSVGREPQTGAVAP